MARIHIKRISIVSFNLKNALKVLNYYLMARKGKVMLGKSAKSESKERVILDSGAVINDSSFNFLGGIFFMPSSAFSELKDMRSRLLADNAVKNGFLFVQTPSIESVANARESAKKVGTKLSNQDLDVLALAIESLDGGKRGTAVRVLTDDYSLQNVLSSLGIPFRPIIHGGIKKHFALKEKPCQNCGTKSGNSACERCGYENP